MHSHGNPKGSEAEFFAAGQPCKIGEDNRGVGENNFLRRPCERGDPYRVIYRYGAVAETFRTTTAAAYGSLRSQGRRKLLPLHAGLLGRALRGFGEFG